MKRTLRLKFAETQNERDDRRKAFSFPDGFGEVVQNFRWVFAASKG